jgi:hypothetical protein
MFIDENDKAYANFSYTGYGRNINFGLKDEDADYLPRMLSTFAEYLRASGFVYVGVKPVEGGWLFTKDYDSTTDDDTWSRPEFTSELFGLDDDVDFDDQSEINQAASDYWDEQVDKAVAGEEINAGDTVFYHGRGEGETTLNDHEQPQGHGGRTGISLINMKGKVVMVTSSPVGPRVLVKWNNWYDGHNGMGDDPNAVMSAKNYWWSNINNVSKSN